ncbi:MAG: signal recognition particle protein [candidate division KSB1 bacterium]|nr:signal recognition particle protein [candidate division KSB1 bacterium]
MFQDLTQRLETVLKKLKGHGKLTEKNIADSLREIRRVLLEADVNYKVVKDFIARVQEKAVGQAVLRSITPGQQVVKIIYDELVELMGKSEVPLNQAGLPPTVIMLVGLHGCGKTTLAGKLARHLKSRGRNPLLVAADVRRPAAIEQLKVVGQKVGVPVVSETSSDPVAICQGAIDFSRKNGYDTAILDTAGRLHIDQELMEELSEIKAKTHPHEILFVADGMTGQDAVNTASEFLKWLDFDGVVLTKMDGDARGGAALSIRAVTGKPIKFISVGEKFDALEKFYPDRMASRILGMGDVVSLVEKAQQAVDQEAAERLEKKLRKQEFTLEDFYDQLQQIKKMGPLDQLLGMIPGLGGKALQGLQVDERSIIKIEAMINSMTPEERRRPQIIDGSRRKRIAKGSGTTVQDLNQLLKQFQMMQKMMKNMSRFSFKGMPFKL